MSDIEPKPYIPSAEDLVRAEAAHLRDVYKETPTAIFDNLETILEDFALNCSLLPPEKLTGSDPSVLIEEVETALRGAATMAIYDKEGEN